MAKSKVKVSITGDNSGLKRSVRGSEQELGRFDKAQQKSTEALKKAGKAAAVGVAAGMAKSVSTFASFDKAMTNSLAIMGDVSGAMRKDMVAAAREVGRQTQFSAKQAGESYFFLASAGLDAAQSLKAMPEVAKFAQAGQFDLAQATDLLTDAQSALGLASKDAGKNLKNMKHVGDVLVKANTLANASVEQFSSSLTNKAAAAAKNLGKDVEETTAILAAFADQGVKGEQAGNALNIVWRDLQTAALKNKDAFREHGVAVFDSQGEMRNTADIVGDLETALGGMSDEQKKATLSQLGFQDRSQSFILTLLGTSEKIGEYEDKLRKAGGTMKEVSDNQMEGFSGALTRLKSLFNDIFLAVGQKVAPVLHRFADSARVFIEQFQRGEGAGGRFAETMRELGTVVVPVIRGIGQVVSGVASFAGSIVSILGPASTLGALLGGLAGRFVALRVVAGVNAILAALPGILWRSTSAMGALNAVMGANPFVRVAQIIGMVAGALLGMKGKTDSAKVSGQQFNDMLRQQVDVMRQVRDIDIDVAQRKANLKSANVSVSQAEQRLKELRDSGNASATDIKAAEADLEQARINQERATREVSRAEEDSTAKRREAAEAAREIIAVERRKLDATNKSIESLKEEKARFDELGVSTKTTGIEGEIYRRIVGRLSDKQKDARGTTIRLKEQQLKLAEATGASKDKVDGLKREIKGLKSKTVTVTAKVKMEATSQALQSVRRMLGGGDTPGGAGWPLTGKELDEAVTKDARRWAQGRADRLGRQVGKALGSVSGMLGGRGASGVDAFTPMSLRMGLSGARGRGQGYRPGDDGWHGVNRARDHSGPPAAMMRFARYLAANFGRKLKELIYTPLGFSIKNGRKVPPFAQADHFDHVHVAMRRGGTVPGTGQGDTRPAMLEPGEFVIRKKVVERFGPTFFTALNGGNGDGTGMGFMSGGQVARLARRAGFRGSNLVTALAIARGESGWREGATNRNTDGSIDRGLWQINSVHGRLSTMNPLGNARAAWRISRGGRDWSPWVVFQKGLHRRHIAAARRAAIATRPGRGRPAGGRGGTATGTSEPHPLDVLPPIHERRMAVADIAHARAEATPGTADDVLAQKRKLAAVDTRIKRVRTALRQKLRPGTRARLRQEYASLLRERQGLIGEMTPEAGIPPTLEDFQAQRTALAGLTPGLGDDLTAAQGAYGLAQRRYMEALPGGDPRQIAEAANNVRAAADQVNQLREQMVVLEEQVRQAAEAERRLWPSAELAMAQLTETLDDDLTATQKLNAINEDLYRQAVAANDPARIAETAGQLKSTRDAIAQLNSTLQQQQAAEQERLRIMEGYTAELKRENDRAEHINAITGREATRALGDLISGEIAGRGYQGRALTAGAGSVYRT